MLFFPFESTIYRLCIEKNHGLKLTRGEWSMLDFEKDFTYPFKTHKNLAWELIYFVFNSSYLQYRCMFIMSAFLDTDSIAICY